MQSLCFRDFDAFASAVRDIDSVMMLQNPSRRIWTINHVYLPDIHVQLGRLGSGNIVEGQSWSNGYLLYLPLTEECAYSANGTIVSTNSFMILEPGCDFCVSTKVEHDWCSIFVPTHKLAGGSDLAEPSSGSGGMKCRVSYANPQLANRFRSLVDQVMTAADQCPQFESSPAAPSAVAELVKVATAVVGRRRASDPVQEGRPKVPRQNIIRCSKELLEERGDAPVHVGELATAAGVSERTLRTAFHDYFGVGPLRYLQLRQLHQVRRALRAADPEAVSATDVLVQHGEWEFSRFARRYQKLFGERPSETLHTNQP